MKIMLTGGHLAPALAILEELQNKKYKDISLIFVGRKYVLDSEKTLSLEYKEITKRNIPFIPLQSGRFNRLLNWSSVKNFFKIPSGFVRAFFVVRSVRPDVVLSFGGYLALPVAFWSFIFRIPVYTHEQTINPGLANRIIAFFSKKIYLSFNEAKKYFPADKTIVTGNPIRNSIINVHKKPFIIEKNQPVIYITGGTLGSHSINLIIKEILSDLLKKYTVIHQTGDTRQYHDYEDLVKIIDKNYFPVRHFYDDEIGYIFNQADLVIGRAGANTFFELIAKTKPAIFIPLPWSGNNEQEEQAKLFKNAKTGEIFYQSDEPQKLIELINKLITNKSQYQKNFNVLKHLYKKDAAKFIVDQIIQKI